MNDWLLTSATLTPPPERSSEHHFPLESATMKYVLLVLTLIALAVAPAAAGVPDDLQRVSVTIKAGNAQGSGTLVTRKIGDDTVTFIWTAAHVVDGLRTTRTVVTPQGMPRILVEIRDADLPTFKPPFNFDNAIHWLERFFSRAGSRSS